MLTMGDLTEAWDNLNFEQRKHVVVDNGCVRLLIRGYSVVFFKEGDQLMAETHLCIDMGRASR